MKDFTENTGFVVSFLIATIMIQMITNNKVTEGFLWLVLLSMVVLNHEKFSNLLSGVMNRE